MIDSREQIELAIKIDSYKLLSKFKAIFEEFDIKKILVADPSAYDDMCLFSKLKTTVFCELPENSLNQQIKKEFKILSPGSAGEKMDLIYLPSAGNILKASLANLRDRLKKKGLIMLKAQKFPEKQGGTVLTQQHVGQTGFLTCLTPDGTLTRIVVTRSGTYFFSEYKRDRVSKKELKDHFKLTGFKINKKVTIIGNDDKNNSNYFSYKFFRKTKRDILLSEDDAEDNIPLMTSGEISERFTEIMQKNNLGREDFNL